MLCWLLCPELRLVSGRCAEYNGFSLLTSLPRQYGPSGVQPILRFDPSVIHPQMVVHLDDISYTQGQSPIVVFPVRR